MERLLNYAITIVTWLKIPAALALALIFFTPPQIEQVNAYLVGVLQRQVRVEAMLNVQRDTERQVDSNSTEIKGLQRRLDLLENMRIDASIASMKATIEYDHTLLMTIAGAVLLLVLGNVLGYFRSRQTDNIKHHNED
jgi:hypothetical protein